MDSDHTAMHLDVVWKGGTQGRGGGGGNRGAVTSRHHGGIKYFTEVSNISRRYQIFHGGIKYSTEVSNISRRARVEQDPPD